MSFHVSPSIDGLLLLSDKDMAILVKHVYDEYGLHPTCTEFRKHLMEEKKLGHKFVRPGGCDNFDPVRGCLGHEKK